MGVEENQTTLATLSAQMRYIQQDVERQAKMLLEISTSLRALTAVEIHQEQILSSMVKGEGRMEALDKRLDTVEREMPSLLETRKWVVGGVLAAVGMMAAAIFQLTILAPALQSQAFSPKPKPALVEQP